MGETRLSKSMIKISNLGLYDEMHSLEVALNIQNSFTTLLKTDQLFGREIKSKNELLHVKKKSSVNI